MSTRFSGWMKRMAALMAAVLALTCATGALAAAKKTKGTIYGADADFFSWVYATDTIPEGVEAVEARGQLYLRNNADITEYVFDCTVEMISGDPALQNALVVHKGKNKVEIAVDNSVVRQPGEAVFRITCEGGKLKATIERTLRVLPYEGNEPVKVQNSSIEYFLHLGEQIKRSRILSEAFTVFYTNVADRLKAEDKSGTFIEPDRKIEASLSGVGARAFRDSFEAIPDASGKQGAYESKKYGYSQLTAGFTFANASCKVPVTLNVLSYHISGSDIVRPGQTGEYTIEDSEPAEGRTFAWKLEGEGAILSTDDSGKATVMAGSDYSVLQLTAVPSTGEPEITRKISISDGVLGAYETVGAFSNGFGVRRITEDGFTYGTTETGGFASFRTDRDTGIELFEGIEFTTLKDFKEIREDAMALYDSLPAGDGTVQEQGDLEIDGHPARYTIRAVTGQDGRKESIGTLRYARHNKMLEITLRASGSVKKKTDPPTVTKSDMVKLASEVSFDENGLEIRQSEGVPRITTKKDVHYLSAGKKLNLDVAFDRADITKNKELNAVTWSVADAEGGALPEGVKIAKNGQLSTDASNHSVLKLKITAVSDIFHSQGEYEVTVVPPVKGVTLDTKEIYLYTGSEQEVTVRAEMKTAYGVPPIGLTWTMNKKDIAEMRVVEDGAAAFKAIKAGKVQVTVKELSGKSAIMKVNVVEAVTGLTLTAKGKAAPGRTVSISAAIEPKKAGNKALEWSCDAAETVATINGKGQLKIAKDAESGTVITVTCRALGAPEPVSAQIQVTVE